MTLGGFFISLKYFFIIASIPCIFYLLKSDEKFTFKFILFILILNMFSMPTILNIRTLTITEIFLFLIYLHIIFHNKKAHLSWKLNRKLTLFILFGLVSLISTIKNHELLVWILYVLLRTYGFMFCTTQLQHKREVREFLLLY